MKFSIMKEDLYQVISMIDAIHGEAELHIKDNILHVAVAGSFYGLYADVPVIESEGELTVGIKSGLLKQMIKKCTPKTVITVTAEDGRLIFSDGSLTFKTAPRTVSTSDKPEPQVAEDFFDSKFETTKKEMGEILALTHNVSQDNLVTFNKAESIKISGDNDDLEIKLEKPGTGEGITRYNGEYIAGTIKALEEGPITIEYTTGGPLLLTVNSRTIRYYLAPLVQ